LDRRGWICTVGLAGLLLASCADTAQDSDSYVVQPQDTLYSIAWRHNLDFRDIARWNHLGPDFRIVVGQTLTLDGVARVSSSSPVHVEPRSSQENSPANSTTRVAPSTAKSATVPSAIVPPTPVPPSARLALKWAWPTDRTSAPLPVAGGGLLLTGRLGQDVHAACAGRVVYIGNGLRGYGNLIIITHGENLLSAYAHNRDIVAHEGQEVLLGELIAHMGEGAAQKPALYFEIRFNGKPVDPIPFLPSTK
jgi:lipoprotein NlpD